MRQAYRVKPELAGKKIRCKNCQTAVSVPAPTEETEDDEFAALLSGPSASEDQEDEPPPPVAPRKTATKKKKKGKAAAGWKMPQLSMDFGGTARGCFYTLFCVLFVLGAVGRLARAIRSAATPAGGAAHNGAPAGPGMSAPAMGHSGMAGPATGTGPYDLSTFPVPNIPELGSPEPGIAGDRDIPCRLRRRAIPTACRGRRCRSPCFSRREITLRPAWAACWSPPAGTNLLTGHNIEPPDYTTEYEPYVNAGMAVVHYSLDGGLPNPGQQPTGADMEAAYPLFRNSAAGLVNGRNAIEFVLRKLPMVNPQKIAAAGHSSAGTHVLLLAEHEPRLSAVIAYAGRVTVSPELLALSQNPQVQRGIPDLPDFVRRSAPATHVSRLRCATFLFHAQDDDVVPASDSTWLSQTLLQQGTSVTLELVANGGHFSPMVEVGYPKAVDWLRSLWGL